MLFTTYGGRIGCETFYVVAQSDIAVGPWDCNARATPRSPGQWWVQAKSRCRCGSRCGRHNRDNRDWVRAFTPTPTPTFTVRIASGSEKVGFILMPTSQPRVYLVHSVHDVQGVPTRVEKGEDLG